MKLVKIDADTVINVELIYKFERIKKVSNDDEINKWETNASDLIRDYYKYTGDGVTSPVYNPLNPFGSFEDVHLVNYVYDQIGKRPDKKYINEYKVTLSTGYETVINEFTYNRIMSVLDEVIM